MLERREILVVEDNAINRATLAGILSSEYRVLECENGQEALAVLNERGESISMIVLDIVMPVMDGYTFLSIVKADPALSSIPVIVTTQSDNESDEVTALAHGATDFVVKPYRPQVILHRIASIIRLRETAAVVNLLQYDRLTGLYSKEFFYQRIREVLNRHPERQYDILCSDVENFKLVNDVFGLQSGDRLLCGIAELHREMAGENGICGRINADQFACLLEHRAEYTDEMFVEAAARVNALSGAKSIGMKWGIYFIEDPSISVEQMCDRALLAARGIKGRYGKHFAAYDDQLRAKLLREQDIIDHMESALAEGQFQVYLQPKYEIRSQENRLAGAEALVRWEHPEWGLQSPGVFIPLFEKNGFITSLDRFVWDSTCALLRAWDDRGYPPIPASVNVSRADIYHADIADILLGIVGKYGLEPARLHLEITESAYTEDPNQIIETVGHLREKGFVIEMDDFGSGYSSLNMLSQMPIDVLKLDMKFVQSEAAKPVDRGVLRFIMDLARWMDLEVVAEGVETRQQMERIRELGCDYVQGYYFARPMPSAEFDRLLDAQEAVAVEEPRSWAAGSGQWRRKLLVADEDAACRDEVRRTFQGQFQLLEAVDAQSTLALAVEHRDGLAAVLLSATLPGLESLPMQDQFRKEWTIWDVPALITGPVKPQMEDRALEMGADEYVCKPYSQKTLWNRVLRAIGYAEARERERSLREEAGRDYQTGLLNRRGLAAAVASLKEEDGPLAVYLFDLDDLKRINDVCGHVEGDRLIQRFGALLQSRAGARDILARYGGDEFVLVRRGAADEADAVRWGNALCLALREPEDGTTAGAACTAGLAFCRPGDTVDEMISRADRALYRAKAGDKGRCGLWKE